jgi:hypothetical protein
VLGQGDDGVTAWSLRNLIDGPGVETIMMSVGRSTRTVEEGTMSDDKGMMLKDSSQR